MKIVVTSRNPAKIAAVEQAFSEQFADESIEVTSADVDSGVGEQPMSDDATRQGARTRASNAQDAAPEVDFWVGAEAGVETTDEQLMIFAWMAVRSRRGGFSEARTSTLPLPSAVRDLVVSGVELGEANDRVFATSNSKLGGGAFGLLSDGRYTRESIYTQTLIIALIPFVNPLYPQCERDRPSNAPTR